MKAYPLQHDHKTVKMQKEQVLLFSCKYSATSQYINYTICLCHNFDMTVFKGNNNPVLHFVTWIRLDMDIAQVLDSATFGKFYIILAQKKCLGVKFPTSGL